MLAWYKRQTKEDSLDFYKITLLVVSGVLLVVFAWQLRRSSALRPGALRDTARQAGLAVTPEVEPILVARLRAQIRATLVGTIIALVISTAILLALPSPSNPDATAPLLLVTLTGLGAAIGAAVAEFRSALVPLGDRPRLARTPTPTRADYLSPVDRWSSAVALAAGAVLLVGLAILVAVNPGDAFADANPVTLVAPGATLWAVALASDVLGRILTTRILQRGQPAGDDVELAWSDALRSRTLRAFAQTPALGAYCSLVVVLLPLGSAASSDSAVGRSLSLAASLSVTVLALALAALAFRSAFSTRTPHYLIRLWPAVAAQLRDPARPVAAAPAGQERP